MSFDKCMILYTRQMYNHHHNHHIQHATKFPYTAMQILSPTSTGP